MAKERVQLWGIKPAWLWCGIWKGQGKLEPQGWQAWRGIGALTGTRTTQHVNQTMQSAHSGPSCYTAQLPLRTKAAAAEENVQLWGCKWLRPGLIDVQGKGSQYWRLWMWQIGSSSELLTGSRTMPAHAPTHAKLPFLPFFLQHCSLLG